VEAGGHLVVGLAPDQFGDGLLFLFAGPAPAFLPIRLGIDF
jgi:hypothetical protein